MFSDMTTSENKTEFSDIGTCCFCGFECNPLSQSCGSCARGISGAAIGLPVPDHLKKFVYNYPYCESCGTEGPIHLSTLENYEKSSFCYCKECLEKKEEKNMCEKCHKNIKGFTCEADDTFMYICYKCKCNGKTCEYC